jgi:hypothetical protein
VSLLSCDTLTVEPPSTSPFHNRTLPPPSTAGWGLWTRDKGHDQTLVGGLARGPVGDTRTS